MVLIKAIKLLQRMNPNGVPFGVEDMVQLLCQIVCQHTFGTFFSFEKLLTFSASLFSLIQLKRMASHGSFHTLYFVPLFGLHH